MTAPLLEIRDLVAGTRTREILRGLAIEIGRGEVHALMGPNGSGKSTLTHVLAGRPGYETRAGSVLFDGVDLLGLPVWERARLGLFVAFQHPVEIPGVPFREFLAAAAAGRGLGADAVEGARVAGIADRLHLGGLLDRPLNVGLSGGEKKRNETLQLALLGARLVVLDEIDSGLDVDGIRDVAAEVLRMVETEGLSVLVITHFARILDHIPPTHTHVLMDGRIVASGGAELARELEVSGYEHFREPAHAPPDVLDL
ncbi:MAG: Fe-S cluster assembly ATPase SufC [Acidimicrobiia bacterium]|nr:Fe-S cluster assembly ATPase SufC [Acidimicrobiia bacterium]